MHRPIMPKSVVKKRPRRKRGSITRDEILSAAGEVLEEYGPEKVTMRLIAERIG
ncbi:MAG: TetR family transcriptional regulator [Spirochaetota bacterium]